MDNTWSREFESVLRSHLPWLTPDETLEPNQVLADKGLDSLETVSLLLDLEDRLGVSFSDSLLATANFSTPAETWSLVEKAADASVANSAD